MSFRYSNQLTSRLRQRLLLSRSEEQLMTATYAARHAGIRAVVDAYGHVKSLTVDPKKEAEYKTPSGEADAEKIAEAAKMALFAANERRVADKTEAYRRSVAAVPEMAREDATLWFVENGGSLRPLPHEAHRDLGAVEYAKLKRTEGAAAAGTASFSTAGLPMDARVSANTAETAKVDPSTVAAWGALRDDVPEVAKTYRPHRAALLQLGDAPAVLAAQRQERAENEAFFWRRVDLIKRAQNNVLTGPKRQYAHHGTEPNDFVDKVELNFCT